MSEPLLSAILPNYNHAWCVGDQVAAILSQSYRNFELILLDDCSTDNSIEVIEATVQGDPRVRLIRNEKNLGVVKNAEKGRNLAKGEYIGFYAADDRVFPGFFEKTMGVLLQAPQAGIGCSVSARFDNQSTRVQPDQGIWAQQPTYWSPDAFADVICGAYMPGYNHIYRRDLYQAAMPSDEHFHRLKWHCDWFINFVIAFRHGVCYVPEILSAIRVDPTSYSAAGMHDVTQQTDVVWTILELLHSDKYRDVMPYFARGGVLGTITHIVRIVMSRPERWDPATMMLMQRPLIDWNIRAMQAQGARSQPMQGR